MKIIKTTLLFVAVLIFTGKGYSQYSNIPITIADTGEIRFTNATEAKLLDHIDAIQKGKIQCDLGFFEVNPEIGPNHWSIPLTLSQIKSGSLIKEKISTHKYNLSISWNSRLDTGYIFGFSRMYYYEYRTYRYGYNNVPLGVFCAPIYDILLNQYDVFLNQKELIEFCSIIRNAFVFSLSDSRFLTPAYYQSKHFLMVITAAPYSCGSCLDSTSCRTVMFSEADSIIRQFSMTNWAKHIVNMLKNGELTAYSDSLCNNPITKYSLEKIFEIDDTVLDGNKHKVVIPGAVAFPYALRIFERWKFDDLKKSRYASAKMMVTRKIKALGINTGVGEIYHATAWLKYDDIKSLTSLNEGKMSLYKEIIDAPLFKKLDVTY